MKNIGIVCYPTFGGSGIVASELGQALSKKHQIHFISYKKPVRFDNANSNIFFHKVDVPVYPLFEYPPYELALTTVIVEVVEKFDLGEGVVLGTVPGAKEGMAVTAEPN